MEALKEVLRGQIKKYGLATVVYAISVLIDEPSFCEHDFMDGSFIIEALPNCVKCGYPAPPKEPVGSTQGTTPSTGGNNG